MATPKSHALMKVHMTCLGEKKLFFWTNVGKPPNKDEMTGTSGNRWTLSLWTGGYEGRESWHWRMQTHPLPGREHGSGTSGCGSTGKHDTGRWSLFKIKVSPGFLFSQKQADLCEFKASLVHRVSSRTARATQRNPISKKNKQTKTKRNNNNNKKISVLVPMGQEYS